MAGNLDPASEPVLLRDRWPRAGSRTRVHRGRQHDGDAGGDDQCGCGTTILLGPRSRSAHASDSGERPDTIVGIVADEKFHGLTEASPSPPIRRSLRRRPRTARVYCWCGRLAIHSARSGRHRRNPRRRSRPRGVWRRAAGGHALEIDRANAASRCFYSDCSPAWR